MTKREAKIEALTHVAMFAEAHADDAETENGPKVAAELRDIAQQIWKRILRLEHQ